MKKIILLADDSVTIRKVVELTFMDEDYELIPAASGGEALEAFERRDPPFDLVIADVHMPGPNGYEVSRQVKKASPSTPVLLLVGTFEQFDEQEASDAGADGHLKKPFDSQDLLRQVRELLDRAASESPEAQPTSAPAPEADAPETEAAAPEPAPEPEPEPEPQAEAHGAVGPDLVDSAGALASETPSEDDLSAPAAAPSSQGEPEVTGSTDVILSDESVDRIARRVVELLSEEAIREVAWDVIPDLAEVVIKERLSELESQVE